MADVFLSYSSKDREAAARVEAALTEVGIDVFWDQEVPVGQDWDTWLRSQLHGARVAVVLWSKTSIASPNVRHEAMIARDASKLVPTMIEALTPEDFPMGLYLLQTVALQDWRNAGSPGLKRLVAEVQARLGRASAPPLRKEGKKGSATMLVAAGVLVLALAGGGWWLTQHKPSAIAASPVAPIAATPASTTASESFGHRLLGHWRFNDAQACKDGPTISMDGDKMVFTTPDTRFVHVIEKDEALETDTRVIEPEAVLGEQYLLTPEFFATSALRSFNLIVRNVTANTRDTWTPCELEH